MKYTHGFILLLVLAICPHCCVSVCPTDHCPANSHCAGEDCTCNEGYYETGGECAEVYPECSSNENVANIADLCHINQTSVENILNAASALQCGKYRQAVVCAVTSMQLYIQPACTSGFIIGVMTRYMALLAAELPEVDFEKYITCPEHMKRVRVQARQETWTSDLADTGGPAYWGTIKQYSPLIYGVLKSAFPDQYVTHNIVSISQGSVLLDAVFELTDDIGLDEAIKEIDSAVNRPEYSVMFQLKYVSGIAKSCSYDGETLPDGTTFLEEGGCNSCVCNSGDITCSTMDCSNAWLYEYCSVTDDCATGNANCLHNRCWCMDGFYDTLAVADDPVGQCLHLKEFGASCDDRRECVGDRADCINSFCGCDVTYEPANGICRLPLQSACAETPDCEVPNSKCVQNVCGCDDGYYEKLGSCSRLKSLDETCTAATDCGDASSECRSGRCVCMASFFQVGPVCEPVRAPGEECTHAAGCGTEALWCVGGACMCGTDYYITGTTCHSAKLLGESCNNTVTCAGSNTECVVDICTCKISFRETGSTCKAVVSVDADDTKNDTVIGAAVGATAGAVIFIVGLIIFLFYRRRSVKKNRKSRSHEAIATREIERQYGLPGLTAPGSVFLAAVKSRESGSKYEAPAIGAVGDESHYFSEFHTYENVQNDTAMHTESTDTAEIEFTKITMDDSVTYDKLKPSGSVVVVCVTPAGSPAQSPTHDMLMNYPAEGPVTFYEPGLLAPDGPGERTVDEPEQGPLKKDDEHGTTTYYPLSAEGNTIVVCVTPAGSPVPSPRRGNGDTLADRGRCGPVSSHRRDPSTSKMTGRHSPLFAPTNRSRSGSPTRDLLKSAEMLAAITDLNPEGDLV